MLTTFVKLKGNHNVILCRIIQNHNAYSDLFVIFINFNESREPQIGSHSGVFKENLISSRKSLRVSQHRN